MRFLIPAAALAFIAAPALAQNTAAPAAPPPMSPNPPAAEAPPPPGTSAPSHRSKHHRMSLQQHFEAANTSHDGHLTKEQAGAAKWTYVDKNFDAIDKDHKGYVTVEDIHGFQAARRGHHMPPAQHS
jgi:hypothetical protein